MLPDPEAGSVYFDFHDLVSALLVVISSFWGERNPQFLEFVFAQSERVLASISLVIGFQVVTSILKKHLSPKKFQAVLFTIAMQATGILCNLFIKLLEH